MSTHLSNVWFKVTELEVVSGSGCTVTTADGEEYLDFSSGIAVTSTGHCHPKVVAAIREQAGKFIHAQVNVYRHPLLEQLATRLAGVTPAGIDTFFFANSGAEATEAAVKLARQATHRQNVIVMDGAFHGRTMMAMAMTTSKTGYRAGYQPLPAGVFVAPFPRSYEWNVDEETAVERARRPRTTPVGADRTQRDRGDRDRAGARRRRLHRRRRTRTSKVCARSATRTGIMFVADEVQSGFARTGRMFAVEHAAVVPDIIVMAKGIASGFPIAGIGASAELMSQWPQGAHGGTYGGNPIGCAAALATIDVIESEHLADNARDQGRRLVEALAKLQADDSGIGDVRGLGLMVGVELVDPDGAPAAARTAAIMRHCLDESNVIFMNCGTGGNVLRWMPPLIVSADEIDRGVAAFAAALKATA